MNATIATIHDNAQGAPTLKLRLRQEPTLKDLCSEHIKDNFFFGIYGDASSPDTCFRLVIDKNTGFFNATKMCQAGGKEYRKWARLEKSKEMMEYYQSCRPDLVGSSGPTYEVREQNNDEQNKQVTGTYVSKDLILAIAMWVSIPFYQKCSEIVNNVFIRENASMDPEERQTMMKLLKKQEDKIQEKDELIMSQRTEIDDLKKMMERMLMEQVHTRHQNEELIDTTREIVHQNNALKEHTNILEDRVIKVQKKLNIAVEDRAPQPDKTIKKERFVMMKRSDAEYPYYVVRGQTAYTASVIRAQKKDHETVEILVDFNHHPNSKTFYNRVKDQLRSQGAEALGNAIRIENSDLTEQDLITILEDVNEEKKVV